MRGVSRLPRTALAGLFLLGILVATGCGCGGAPTPPPVAAASGTFVLPTPHSPASNTLYFGIVPDSDVLKKYDRAVRLRNLLAARLQRPIELRVADSYAGIVKGMMAREYHLVRPAPKGYVDGRAGGYDAVARPIKGKSSTYQGMIVVNADSPIKTLADLKGKSFAFVDDHSASGFLYALALLLANGIDPDRDLSFYNFLGGHDNVVVNVFQRQFDAGACYHDARLVTFKDHPERVDRLRVLALTASISNPPIAVRSDLPTDLKEAIVDCFVHLPDSPEGQKVLQDLGGITGFERCTDRDYDSIRDMQRVVGPWLRAKGIPLPDN